MRRYHIVAAFGRFNQVSAGGYEELYEVIAYNGVSIAYIVFQIGVWAAILAVMMIGYLYMTKGNKVTERSDLKRLLVKVILVICIFLNVAGMTAMVFSFGLDN